VPIVQESTRDAIKTAIAANSKGTVGKHQIVIIKISAVQRRNLQGERGASSSSSSSRQLQAAVGGVTVDYQVTVQGSADPTQTEGARTRTRTHTHAHTCAVLSIQALSDRQQPSTLAYCVLALAAR
jgi:hypothetical protein